jgi:hypothetical protein
VRRFTFITIIVLFVLIAGAAIYQIVIASEDRSPYPGPAPGTPLPSTTPPS